jgi:2-phospho-L-lactate/phosphoenolpyruvate guanylyltransferase
VRYAIVPVKSLALAKSRLAGLLDAAERRALALAMLEDVLRAAERAASIDRTLVVSRDPTVLRAARALGAQPLPDRADGLNAAIAQAAQVARAAGADHMLALHADLPLVTPAELEGICAAPRDRAQLALAPARDGGTNALGCRLPPPLPFWFGRASLERHLAEARERGLEASLVRLPGLERDIDRPEDLVWLLERPGDTLAQRYVRTLGVIERVACV